MDGHLLPGITSPHRLCKSKRYPFGRLFTTKVVFCVFVWGLEHALAETQGCAESVYLSKRMGSGECYSNISLEHFFDHLPCADVVYIFQAVPQLTLGGVVSYVRRLNIFSL